MKQRFGAIGGREATTGYALMVPLLLVVISLIAYPFASSIWISFNEKRIGMPPRFIGFRNYIDNWNDPLFRKTVYNSCVYTFSAVSLKLLVGLGLALVLNQQLIARNFFRGLMLLPWIIPTVVTALTWRWMFDDMAGIINHVLIKLGIIHFPLAWLGIPHLAMPAIIITNVWRGFPFFGISILAGLQTIPPEQYEAARVDGANYLQRFIYITLPGLKPVLIVTTLLSTIWTFNDFELVWVLTQGGPVNATQIFATLTYRIAFGTQQLGKGLTVSLIILPFLLALVIVLTKLITARQES
ncbi:MAG: sugar ABC transporter permease [Deltaproteobacteria bacterium]|nr:sugar ABC transporter permease [Deltaproteobacteria bacterium]MBW1962157.1 sugar ABC transporter permease [Deltaproteobacteria bacterium]MBW2154175.1 sugar ABC transporter permease [Deltaproteobacteria bacterium]